jgi:uncharacterized protein YdeI (YjbR/CyaY-like superfamily)
LRIRLSAGYDRWTQLKKAAGSIRCKTMPVEPIYFADTATLKDWFGKHAAEAAELIIGITKTSSGLPGITWPQAVDEALCVGWIDGVRHRIDDQRYKIRFTPRKFTSHWSLLNIRRVAALQAEGCMTLAGMAVFMKRTEAKSGTASYEQTQMPELDASETKQFRRQPVAWAYFESRPPSYRKKVLWLVVKARQPSTRQRRLASLIDACALGKRL